MKRPSFRVSLARLASLLLMLLCVACATDQGNEEVGSGTTSGAASLHARYAQVSFGKDATFALCVEPACPRVTPKTLAAESASESAALRDASPTASSVELPQRARAPASRSSLNEVTRAGSGAVRARDRVVIHFPEGSADMTAEAKLVVAQALPRTHPPRRIVIAGLGDGAGKPKANDPLMLRRAMAVRSYVVDAAPRLAGSVSIDALGRCCFGADSSSDTSPPVAGDVEIVFTSFGVPK